MLRYFNEIWDGNGGLEEGEKLLSSGCFYDHEEPIRFFPIMYNSVLDAVVRLDFNYHMDLKELKYRVNRYYIYEYKGNKYSFQYLSEICLNKETRFYTLDDKLNIYSNGKLIAKRIGG